MAAINNSCSKTISEKCQFGPWSIVSVKSHILPSEGEERSSFEGELEIPQLPEMIFAKNVLRLELMPGAGLSFNALDALKCVDAHHDKLKVAVADAWKESRSDNEHIKEVIKPFDWTYTTDYSGTLLNSNDASIKVSPTTERIDLEKLKKKEKILFYDDIILYEDELADNGASVLNIKIRVMPTNLFILMRLFMRVDNVIIRVNDTRLYYELGQTYLLREYTSRDDKISDIKAPAHILTDPNEVSKQLTIRKETFERLDFSHITDDSSNT